ncbi:MAG: arsenate reductase (glutaredoxin) [Sandaracinaceae bacterium]|nr:arsenate reductase (glutaredoxin) [Sandaracinaceae bacterium]
MTRATIWHNPRCSKSREALALLEGRGVTVTPRLYLEDPPDAETLRAVLKKLGMSARELLRRKEDAYKALGLGNEALTDDALIDAMVANPKLIERPIVLVGKRAALGRPPEDVLRLL